MGVKEGGWSGEGVSREGGGGRRMKGGTGR